MTSWKEGWKGQLIGYLPPDNYSLGFKMLEEAENRGAIKKRWSQTKVPSFLYSYFPLVWINQKVCYEFLTGKSILKLDEGMPCWKLECLHTSHCLN